MTIEQKEKQKRKLKSLRVLAGLSQQDMAEELGLTRETYCKKENGRDSFSLEEAKHLADFFEGTVDEIFFD